MTKVCVDADADRAPIDTKVISQEETEISVVLTARYVRRAVIDARQVTVGCDSYRLLLSNECCSAMSAAWQ